MARKVKSYKAPAPLYIGDQPRISPEQGGLIKRTEAKDWLKDGFWVEVISSNVKAVRYDKDFMRLWVRFKGGKEYYYEAVNETKAWMCYHCSSFGGFVHQHLKRRHTVRGPF
jgi:hypothetical protein